jgi:aerobic C4-dicarboxylate transport protein
LQESVRTSRSFITTLYFRVLVGIATGVLVGVFFPHFGEAMKPFADGFIKLIRMLIAPVIFFTIVLGVAGVGDLRRLGRVGLKALLYFEVVTTLALGIGMVVANVFKPGRGMNVDVSSLNGSSVAQYTSASTHHGVVEFLLNIIPDSFVGAFTGGEILQVLVLAILCGIALNMLEDRKRAMGLVGTVESLNKWLFKLVALVMEAAPIGAFGAMAFTVGLSGVRVLLSLLDLLLCVYGTSLTFVFVVLGFICWRNGVSLWRLLVYLKGELLLVLATSSSEAALPRLLEKMENLGCSKMVTGLVIPAGYSFNLDGTSIYLTVAALFIAQATNVHLTLRQQLFILAVLMLNSKGAAAVTGGGFITLAATLSALGTIPVAGIALILGVDRFMSEMRSLTNLVGNSVATIVVARWEGQFDEVRAGVVLSGEAVAVERVTFPG